jgi:hypothetical protein
MEHGVFEYVFSAKGATLSASLGQTPQAFIAPKSISAESAIHFQRR